MEAKRKVIEVLLHVKYICTFENLLIIDKRHKNKKRIIRNWKNNLQINY